tara:strand:+ start:8640 stop:9533 length:894 start_codon:yes stop_codon:yes gene_type:complete
MLKNTLSKSDYDSLVNCLKSNQPFFLKNIDLKLEDLKEFNGFSSLDNLYKEWPKEVDSYLPGIADEVNSVTLDKEEAFQNYREGKSLLFNDANLVYEELQKMTEDIQTEFGFSQLTIARSLLYAVPSDHGTDPHFDQNYNFIYQLQGKKKWWISENTEIINPLSRYTIGSQPEPELESYAEKIPSEFPETNTKEYLLEEGSFLFVPRGAWHKTQSIGSDSLALNFTYTVPSWLDLFLSALRGKLALDSKWRDSALFVNHPDFSFEATDEFDELLAILPYDSPNWIAENILSITESNR